MSGNRAVSVLLTDLRDMLNEPVAGFWTDEALIRYLRRAHRKFYALHASSAAGHNAQTESLSYTGGSRYVAMTADPPVDRIIKIEDRTDAAADSSGPMIREAEGLEEVLELQAGGSDLGNGSGGYPAVFWLENFETIATGVRTIEQRLWLAPAPGSTRTLLIRYQAEPSDFDSTTDTSGVPEYVEDCVLLQAAIYARLQEENPSGIGGLKNELTEAENLMRKLSRAGRRGPGRIKYRNVD